MFSVNCCSVKQISDIFVTALNQGLIQFELKADTRIIVYITQQTLGEFVCNLRLFLLVQTNNTATFETPFEQVQQNQSAQIGLRVILCLISAKLTSIHAVSVLLARAC